MRGELHGEAGTEPAALLAPEDAPPPPPLPPGFGIVPGAPGAPGPLGTTPPSISCKSIQGFSDLRLWLQVAKLDSLLVAFWLPARASKTSE